MLWCDVSGSVSNLNLVNFTCSSVAKRYVFFCVHNKSEMEHVFLFINLLIVALKTQKQISKEDREQLLIFSLDFIDLSVPSLVF